MKRPDSRSNGAGPGVTTKKPDLVSPGNDSAAALRFLKLLGKDPAETWFRIIRHKNDGTRHPRGGADLHGLDLEALSRDNANGWSVYYVSGNAGTATSVHKKDGKPTGAVWEGDINSCPAVFAEWDDKPIEWQLSAWRVLGLPEPTVMVLSGGKSVHCYWVLTTPIAPEQWRPLQSRLIDHCGSDKKCKDPCRVMRLPGFQYVNKTTNKPTGQTADVVHESGKTYTVAELEAYLTLPPKNINRDTNNIKCINQSENDLPPRPLDDIQAAAQYIPERVVGGNTYEPSRRALCGCAAALAEIGLPEEQALDLLAPKWPDRKTAEQALNSSTTRNPAAFWAIAKENGFDTSRNKGERHRARQQQQEPRTAAPAGAPRPSGKQQRQAAPDQPPESFQQLIERLPDGWVQTKHGPRPSKIRVGKLATLIEGKACQLLRFNEMTMYVEANTSHGWQAVKDAEMDSAYVLLDQKGWITTLESVIKAICHVARQRTIHPVREYLLRIEQDTSIAPYDLDRVAADLFRSKSALHGAMFRKWLIGAVARAMDPGCQMDYCLVLQSPEQGLYKSTALATLASQDWHTSTDPKDDKDFLLNVHSNWIYELAELESVTSKRAVGHMKNLITTRVDNFRVPYGRTTEPRKRSSVFCGSANTDSFLRDETGDRRYWVIPIEGKDKLNIQAIRAHRDAIWKAALIAHRAGELPMLSAEQEAESEQQNEGFKEQDAWLEMLQAWIGGTPLLRLGKDDPTPKPYIDGDAYSSADILYAAGLKRPDQINRADETRLGPLLRSLGFAKERVRVGVSRLQRWTNRTNLDQPQTAEVGQAEPVAPQSVSDSGPTGPTEKANVGRKQREQAGTIHRQAHGNSVGELLKQEVGQLPAPARNASAANGSEWTNPPHVEVGPEVGPKLNPPPWLPQLLAIHAAHPNAHPSQLANLLQLEHGITTNGKRIRELLDWHDQQAAA